MNQLNEVSEIELIKKWKKTKDENIALFFYNKYKNELVGIMFSKIRNKFSSVPLEKDDLFYYVWKSILFCLNTYKSSKNKSFKNYIFEKTYYLILREASKFLTNKHIVLNTSYSYENVLLKNNELFLNGVTNINNNSYDLVRDDSITPVLEFNKQFDINLLKQVIYLRSLGYTIEEIVDETKSTITTIRKMIDFACKIAKKLYD